MSVRDRIKQSASKQVDQIEVPEWGVTLGVRSMSARQRAELNRVLIDDSDNHAERQVSMWRALFLGCLVEVDTGDPVFTPDDIDWVFDADISVIDRIATRCLEVSRIGKAGVDEAGKDSLDSAGD